MRDTGLFSCVTAAQSPVNKLSFLSTLPSGPVNVMYPLLRKGFWVREYQTVFWFASCKKCSRKQVFLA